MLETAEPLINSIKCYANIWPLIIIFIVKKEHLQQLDNFLEIRLSEFSFTFAQSLQHNARTECARLLERRIQITMMKKI